MLQDTIDNDSEPYRIIIDGRHPHRLLLVSRAMLEQRGEVEPLWHRDAADTRSFKALTRWTAIRRDRWQEWGELAESLGHRAFYQHMRERMEIEPPAECLGTMLTRMEDPAEILIAESMHGPQGLFTQPLYVHRFASPTARDRFYDWLYSDDNVHAMNELAMLGYQDGATALGEALDRIASEPIVGSRAERRRRAKSARKAARRQPSTVA